MNPRRQPPEETPTALLTRARRVAFGHGLPWGDGMWVSATSLLALCADVSVEFSAAPPTQPQQQGNAELSREERAEFEWLRARYPALQTENAKLRNRKGAAA